MFVYLTGYINKVIDYEYFRGIEIKLIHEKHCRVNNLINVSSKNDIDYKRERIKNVLKAEKVIFTKGYENCINALEEEHIAKFLNIPIEYYND